MRPCGRSVRREGPIRKRRPGRPREGTVRADFVGVPSPPPSAGIGIAFRGGIMQAWNGRPLAPRIVLTAVLLAAAPLIVMADSSHRGDLRQPPLRPQVPTPEAVSGPSLRP